MKVPTKQFLLDLISLDKDSCIRTIEEANFLVRITKEDENYNIVTRDFKKDRINLEIKQGIVVNSYNG